jgi:hypothetical protein
MAISGNLLKIHYPALAARGAHRERPGGLNRRAAHDSDPHRPDRLHPGRERRSRGRSGEEEERVQHEAGKNALTARAKGRTGLTGLIKPYCHISRAFPPKTVPRWHERRRRR